MKRLLFFIFTLLFASLCTISGQSFLRYHMNDSTYNGFYTENIDSIRHELKGSHAIASIFTNNGMQYDIELDKVDSITIERALVDDGDVGQYRIYQINSDTGIVKTILADNRASLFASYNGDFGANDTILYSSAYNDATILFLTNEEGRIKKIFNGEDLLFLDYSTQGKISILNCTTEELYQIETDTTKTEQKGVLAKVAKVFFANLLDLADLGKTQTQREAIDIVAHDLNSNNCTNAAANLARAFNNPEQHHQILFVDGLSIAGDLVGIGAAVAGGIPTAGMSLVGLGVATGLLMTDLIDLGNDLWPDAKQMKKYSAYYQNKYNLRLQTLQAEDVSYTGATLRGEASSLTELNGTFYFLIDGQSYHQIRKRQNVANHSCVLSSEEHGMKPGDTHFYSLYYRCVIDGLLLTFGSDNYMQFTLQKPTVHTGSSQTTSENSVEVSGTFYDVPDGAECGIVYSWSGGQSYKTFSDIQDGVHYVSLTDLQPNTTYQYSAYVKIDGFYVQADEIEEFTTQGDAPDLSGEWIFQVEGEETVLLTLEEVPWSNRKNTGTYTYGDIDNVYGEGNENRPLYLVHVSSGYIRIVYNPYDNFSKGHSECIQSIPSTTSTITEVSGTSHTSYYLHYNDSGFEYIQVSTNKPWSLKRW